MPNMPTNLPTYIYSVCLPFHTASFWYITIQWTSHDDLTEKYFSHFTVNQNEKTCQMTEIQNCTLRFDKKTASVEFCQHAVLD